MNKNDLVHELESILEIPQDTLQFDQPLSSYPGWNSMAQISLIALFDKHLDKNIDYADIEELQTAQDIMNLI